MPDPVDAELLQQVGELSRKLDDVRDVLQQKFYTARRSIRRSNIIGVLGAVSFLFVVIWLWHDARNRDHDNVARLVAACESSNKAREQSQARIEDAGGTLTDSFARVIASANPAMTPEAAARTAGLFEKVKADYVQHMRDNWPVELRPRDCSAEAVTAPTVVGR